MRKAEAALMAVLDEQELKSTSADIEGVHYTTSVQQRTITKFDEAGLKKALGAKAFSKLTIAKLDSHKLERAVDEGLVDPHVVAQHTTITPGTRSVRLTRKVPE